MIRRPRMTLAVCALALLTSAGLGVWWWRDQPRVPDPALLSTREAVQFIASDDFNRMTEAHRLRFTLAVVDRHRACSFEELMAIMLDRSDPTGRDRAAANIRRLRRPQKVTSRLFGLYLDKFYELPAWRRQVYLTTFVLAQQGKLGPQMIEYHTPTPERFHDVMMKFAGRDPRVQALIAQFLLDFQSHRQSLGLGDKW